MEGAHCDKIEVLSFSHHGVATPENHGVATPENWIYKKIGEWKDEQSQYQPNSNCIF